MPDRLWTDHSRLGKGGVEVLVFLGLYSLLLAEMQKHYDEVYDFR